MSLVAKTLSGMRWTTLAMVTNVSFNLGYTAVMARLLAPSAFGLIAMAQIAIRFLSYFAQLGVAPALVQKPELAERDIRAALTLSVGINALLFALMWLLAPLAGRFFGNPEVVPLLRGLSAAFLFSGFSVVSVSLLRRRFMFKQLAVVEIASYILGYGVVGIGSAFYGLGVWSLVFAVIGQEAITLAVSYAFVRHNLRPLFAWHDIRHFLHYGSKYSVIGFLEYISANVDSLLIGRWYGETVLGLYNRAQMLVKLPMHHVGNAITKVLFPVLSSAQADKQKMASAYLAGWVLIGSLAASISLALVPAASDAVLTLLGSQWKAAIPIVEIAAFAVPFAFLTVLSGIVCDAQGLLWPKLIIQCLTLLVLGLSIYVLRGEGALGFAKAMVITEAFRLALYIGLHFGRLPLAVSEFLKVNAAVVFTAAVSMLAVWQTARIAHAHALPVWASLIAEIATGGVGFTLIFGLAWLWLRRMPAFLALKNHLPLLDRIERIYPAALIGRHRAA
ncbi:MAG: lipopolysaccharide biosynthesis protein [Sulfuricella sp.]|nr:lipopolysaccharide biosynthesis protein [Gammaproteobacteria bacterium]